VFNKLLNEFNLELSDIEKAFLHISYANLNGLESNERLEFLGDSIINFYTTLTIVEKFRDFDEGKLSKLRARMVSSDSLSKIFKTFNLKQHLKIIGDISKKIEANTVEAIVASAYLAFSKRKENNKIADFVNEFVLKHCLTNTVDYKSEFQEIIQSKHQGEIIYNTYKTGSLFKAQVLINGKIMGEGVGDTKKFAEQNSAKNAISKLEK